MEKIKIENVKKGDFVRRKPDAKKVFRAGGYCKFERKYILDDYDDISRCISIKKAPTYLLVLLIKRSQNNENIFHL